MRKPLAVILLVFAMPTAVLATTEGYVSELPSTNVEAARTATYERVEAKGSSTSALKHSQARAKASSATREIRSAKAQSFGFGTHIYFRNASTLLLTDRDHDGYFSEFRVRFDADSDVGDVRVYAKLYLRRFGESDWLLYHTTDDFWLDGRSGSDDYYVTTKLEAGYATAEYDVLIDLYEVGYSDIVATIGPADTDALGYVPLEEIGLDVPIELPGYSIGEVHTLLITDQDGDGHYSRFEIEFDPDADFNGAMVYANIWVRAQGGDWIEEHTSEDFFVDASGSADAYRLGIEWLSGYPTSFYDVQIDLYDAATGLLVATAGSERPELAQIPLEDRSRDRRPNPPVVGGGGSSSSRESGGGAFGFFWLAALGLLLGLRRARG